MASADSDMSAAMRATKSGRDTGRVLDAREVCGDAVDTARGVGAKCG